VVILSLFVVDDMLACTFAQGSEADVVIICTTRNNAARQIGFLKDPKRVNVAISRAKQAAVILGNRDTLSHDKLWARVLSYTVEIVDGNMAAWPQKSDHFRKQADSNVGLNL
jgi:hypothetical protein